MIARADSRGRPHHGRIGVIDRRYPVWSGPRAVVVGRPDRLDRAALPAGYGPGRRVTRHVRLTPWGWHKIVTTKTCLVP